MSFLDVFQDIAIVLYLFNSRITNNYGAVGAFLLVLWAILKGLAEFDTIFYLMRIASAGV
jgi:hypothetical protein